MYLENSIEPDNKTERSKAQQMVRRDPHREEDLGERFSQFASAHGTAVGNDLRSDNDTPALNALKALRGALISMSRGEIPVGCCQWPSGYGTFHITHAEAHIILRSACSFTSRIKGSSEQSPVMSSFVLPSISEVIYLLSVRG